MSGHPKDATLAAGLRLHQANLLAVGVYNADTQARLAASPRNPLPGRENQGSA
ncbi:MAG TPA: hypothetical protein VI864_03870 [Candidatus Bathyarchaeia archaeon]|nr:hypothetical protein [Candidatus Bathyarchaeia archaeon]